jgi:hypothetical protein
VLVFSSRARRLAKYTGLLIRRTPQASVISVRMYIRRWHMRMVPVAETIGMRWKNLIQIT